MTTASKVQYIFKLKTRPSVPIDVRNIRPTKILGMGIDEVRKLRVYEGNRRITAEDIFDIEGPSRAPQNVDNIEIVIIGDTGNKFRYLGYKMDGGRIVVKGDGGHLLGYKMSKGTIYVEGSVGDWCGAKMKGGDIEVKGDAGNWIGAKLKGEKPGRGMRGGTIVVHGSAKSFIGFGMGGGTIVIEGSVGDVVGGYMTGGTILVVGSAGFHHGVGMSGGRVIIAGKVGNILPVFYIDAIVSELRVRGRVFKKPFATFIGDATSVTRGTLTISYEENRELIEPLEKYLAQVI